MIKVYGTKSCHYCGMVKEYFKSKGLEFEYADVGVDMEARKEMLDKSSSMSVPTIDVNGKILVGFNRDRLDEIFSGVDN